MSRRCLCAPAYAYDYVYGLLVPLPYTYSAPYTLRAGIKH